MASLVLGCGRTEYPPISIDVAREVETGTPLAEVKKVLGEPHPPTSMQEKRLDEMVSRMLEPTRSKAQGDESLAWGNDNEFLVVKVNDQGIIWARVVHSGQSPPPRRRPPRP
jgi:hypothetical protein